MKQALVFGLLATFILSACTPVSTQTPLPSLTAQSNQMAPTQTAQPTAQPRLCEGVSTPPPLDYTLTIPDVGVEILWRPSFVPWWVRSSPDGRVLAVTYRGDSIYELKPDGTLAVVFHCPGVVIETFASASDGALWFSSWDGGRLYRVAPDESISLLAQSGNRYLEAGPDGSVYAMENGLVRIDPDGNQKIITAELEGHKFAIGPKGEMVALRSPDIVRVSESGELSVIASDYGPENWLTFGADGLLYVTHWSSIHSINLETGERNVISWLENSNLGESGTFAQDGRLIMYHPITNVFAVDLAAQTTSLYHQVLSNSWAMAANPDDTVYMAFGNKLPNGQTSIYRILDEQTLELVATAPYGYERAMAFDFQGMGYLAVSDAARGSAIFRFDPSSGAIEEYQRTQCNPSSLVLNPETGKVWWEDCTNFYSLDEDGKLSMIPGVLNGFNSSLAITPDGEFYIITFFPRTDMNLPFEHRLYHWDVTAWVEVVDMTQSDPNITMALLVACPDGYIYTVEGLDAAHVSGDESSGNAVRRLETNDSLTLIGYDFSFDGLASDCDRTTGRIIFTSGAGIFALTPP